MSTYWKRALVFARKNTKTFTPWKAIPTALATVARWYFGPPHVPIRETLLIVATAVTAYLLCHLIDFILKLLIVAPAELDRITQAKIADLQDLLDASKVPVLEQQRRNLVREKLAGIPEGFREVSNRVLRYLLLQTGEAERVTFGIPPFNSEHIDPIKIFEAINQLEERGLITNTKRYPARVAVKPELKDALIFLLLNGR